MNKPFLNKRTRYHQGKFNPVNPEKYVGNPTEIFYRSKWERIFLNYLDRNPSVVAYGSEEVVIPYISPVDNKQHRYFVDFFLEYRQANGKKRTFLVEIKPYAQTRPPKMKEMNESYINELQTYHINRAKWEAADKFCKARGIEFIVLTEKELFKQTAKKGKYKNGKRNTQR